MILLDVFIYKYLGEIAHFLIDGEHVFFKVLRNSNYILYEELCDYEQREISNHYFNDIYIRSD